METINNLVKQSLTCSQRSSVALQQVSTNVIERANAAIARYGDFNNFCSLFNTKKCNEYLLANKDEMYVGTAPTLLVLKTAYGEKMAITWLELYIVDVLKCNGLYEKADIVQLESVCQEIMIHYSYLKVTEMMIFFSMFKSCKFRNERGEDATKMYGEFQGSVLMDCLQRFLKDRAREIDRIERERAPKVDYSGCITYEEFKKLMSNKTNQK